MRPVSKEFLIRSHATAPSALTGVKVDAAVIADLQNHRTFKLAQNDVVCNRLDMADQRYKQARPATGVHPMGPCRHILASALLDAFAVIAADSKGPLKMDDVCQQYPFARALAKGANALLECSKTQGFGFLQPLVAFCTYTCTHDKHRLLKIRPCESILSGGPWKTYGLEGFSSKLVLECLLLPYASCQCDGPGVNSSTEDDSLLGSLKADFDRLTATRALGDARLKENPDVLKEAIERARCVGTPTRASERLLTQMQDRSLCKAEPWTDKDFCHVPVSRELKNWGFWWAPGGARRLREVLQMVDCPDSHGLCHVLPAGNAIRCCDVCGQARPSELFFACAGEQHKAAGSQSGSFAERAFKICRPCAARAGEEELAVRSAGARNALDLPGLRVAIREAEYLSGNGPVLTRGAETAVIAEARRKLQGLSHFVPLDTRQQKTPKQRHERNNNGRRPQSAVNVGAESRPKKLTLKEWLEELDPSLSSDLISRVLPILEYEYEHLTSFVDFLKSDGVDEVLRILENTRMKGSKADPEPLTGQQELLLRHGAASLLKNGVASESGRLRQARELRQTEFAKAAKARELEAEAAAAVPPPRPAPIEPWLQGIAKETRCETLHLFEGWLKTKYDDLYELACAGPQAVLEYLDSVADPPPRIREKQLLTKSIQRLGKFGPEAELQRFFGSMFWTDGTSKMSCGGARQDAEAQTHAISSVQTRYPLRYGVSAQTDKCVRPQTDQLFAQTQTHPGATSVETQVESLEPRKTRNFATQKDAEQIRPTRSSGTQTQQEIGAQTKDTGYKRMVQK